MATAEIRDAQIRPKQVRAISQKGQLIVPKLARVFFVPQIFEVSRFFNFRHKSSRSIVRSVVYAAPICRYRRVQTLPPEKIDRQWHGLPEATTPLRLPESVLRHCQERSLRPARPGLFGLWHRR